jgi:hypothetical protein
MAKYKIIQGNSLRLDLSGDTAVIDTFDNTWSHYSGVWDISATIDGAAIAGLSGALTRSSTVGIFHFAIGPVSGGVPWTTLPLGTYYIRYQIINPTIDYLEELRDTLTVIAQGIA